MIIRRHGTTALLITQPDHAHLAQTIMERWREGGLSTSPRRAAILHAIREHDNGWSDLDSAPIVDSGTGEILDFMNLPDDDRRGVWPRGVQRLAETPYSAALVAQHAIHIYRRYRADPAWAAFFTEMESWRDRYLRLERGATTDDLLRDYMFLRIGDLASLTFCNGWSDAPDETGFAMRFADEHLVISPDPFGGERLSIEIGARQMPGTHCASPSDAVTSFMNAPTITLAGTVSGSP